MNYIGINKCLEFDRAAQPPACQMVTSNVFSGSSRRVRLLAGLAAILLANLAAPPLYAQNAAFDELEVKPALKASQSDVTRMLREGRFANAEAQQIFDSYYNDYALARWTLVKDVTKLLDYRKDLRNHLRLSKSGQVFNHLNSLALEFLTKLAAGNYHPAVRINATLAIGELNSVEQSATEAPVPLPAALNVLVAAVGNQQVPDSIRAVAMVGILRHASAKISDPEARRSLTNAMLKIVSTDLSAGSAAAGQEWILGQAVETLGHLKSPGENAAVARAILKVLVNKKLSFSTRTIAADALGNLNFAAANGINAAAGAVAIGQFALDTCLEELRLAQQTGYPVSRRRMKQRLEAAASAVTAITPLAQADQQAFFTELATTLKDASAQFDAKGSDARDMGPVVLALRQKLDAWLKKKPQ